MIGWEILQLVGGFIYMYIYIYSIVLIFNHWHGMMIPNEHIFRGVENHQVDWLPKNSDCKEHFFLCGGGGGVGGG